MAEAESQLALAASEDHPYCALPQVTHLDTILLNGNNVAVLVPGGKPEEDGQ